MIISDNSGGADSVPRRFPASLGEVVFMKKTIALLLAFGLLAGCTPQEPDSSASSGAASSQTAQAQYEQVTLFLPNDSADGLVEESASIEVTGSEEKAEELVQVLAANDALPDGTETVSVTWKDGKLTVDLNTAFADGLMQSGTAGETMILASLVNTLWAYYEPEELTLTANGKPLETGHNIYEEPFTGPYVFD